MWIHQCVSLALRGLDLYFIMACESNRDQMCVSDREWPSKRKRERERGRERERERDTQGHHHHDPSARWSCSLQWRCPWEYISQRTPLPTSTITPTLLCTTCYIVVYTYLCSDRELRWLSLNCPPGLVARQAQPRKLSSGERSLSPDVCDLFPPHPGLRGWRW